MIQSESKPLCEGHCGREKLEGFDDCLECLPLTLAWCDENGLSAEASRISGMLAAEAEKGSH